MRPDLSDFGIEIDAGRSSAHEIRFDTSKLEVALRRFRDALDELRNAWRALPPAVRSALAPFVVTLSEDT